jgi:hypothetical protein
MILIGLVTTMWIGISLLGIAVCRAAGVSDRQQQKTSCGGLIDRIASALASCAAGRPSCQGAHRVALLGARAPRPCEPSGRHA